ncbi:MAG: hypothetical protein M3285_14110 [Actinomycetota bacterium]|nr:hypothetical protein [Actinomycetota bacterium]
MRNHKFSAAVLGAALALSVVPTMASAGPKTGTWTFFDTTADPSTAADGRPRCTQGELPHSPVDQNTQTFKITKKRATFSVMSNNVADWAMELHDKKGNILATSDGGSPEDREGVTMLLKKGTYTVYYCNWAGEPQITADWSIK